ncbi:MAG: TRAP transporter substrate-binding protein DctP, partial [Bacteroidota bacterium]
GLCFYDAGSRSFYTRNRPIQSAKDVEGLKIRVMKSITANKMIKEMEGSPVPISWGELYTALQQGVVDGAENNPPSFQLSRHYEICKFYSLDKHTAIPDVLIMSTIVWDRLSPQEQDWIETSALESVVAQRAFWREAEAESLRIIKEAGVEVIEPDLTSFQDATRNIVNEFSEDELLLPIINKIKAAGEKAI